MEEEIVKLYRSGLSMAKVAEKTGTNSKRVYQTLIKCSEPIRSKSQVQSDRLKTGTAHPTKGKPREESVKNTISRLQTERYEKMSTEERQKISDDAKVRWNDMDDKVKRDMLIESRKKIREASKSGSKLEKKLLHDLVSAGFSVIAHKKELICNERLELDLFLPVEKIILEADGISHSSPVWGAEKLDDTINADMKKNGLLLAAGYVVIRIQYDSKLMSRFRYQKLLNELLEIIKRVGTVFPSKEERFIVIKVL